MKYLGIICFVVCLTSCSDKEEDKSKETPFEEEIEHVTEVYMINSTYPEYEDPSISVALEQLGFCTNQDSAVSDSLSKCSHELFRVFPLDTSANFGEGFIMEARVGALKGANTRSVIVVKNINGVYQQMNFLKGKLLELRQTNKGNFWLLMQYRVPQMGTVAVRHEWDERGMTFLPADVEEINNSFVKEAYKDSINHLYLDHFPWGY